MAQLHSDVLAGIEGHIATGSKVVVGIAAEGLPEPLPGHHAGGVLIALHIIGQAHLVLPEVGVKTDLLIDHAAQAHTARIDKSTTREVIGLAHAQIEHGIDMQVKVFGLHMVKICLLAVKLFEEGPLAVASCLAHPLPAIGLQIGEVELVLLAFITAFAEKRIGKSRHILPAVGLEATVKGRGDFAPPYFIAVDHFVSLCIKGQESTLGKGPSGEGKRQ